MTRRSNKGTVSKRSYDDDREDRDKRHGRQEVNDIHALGRTRALEDTDRNVADILTMSRDDEAIDSIHKITMNPKRKHKRQYCTYHPI